MIVELKLIFHKVLQRNGIDTPKGKEWVEEEGGEDNMKVAQIMTIAGSSIRIKQMEKRNIMEDTVTIEMRQGIDINNVVVMIAVILLIEKGVVITQMIGDDQNEVHHLMKIISHHHQGEEVEA
jgi:hypothetical protein